MDSDKVVNVLNALGYGIKPEDEPLEAIMLMLVALAEEIESTNFTLRGLMPGKAGSGEGRVTLTQVSIALGKLYSGTGPGDELWCELDYEALEFAVGAPVERK